MAEGKRYGIDRLRRTGGRGTISMPILTGFNMGAETLNLTMPMGSFRDVALVANEARIISVGEGPDQIAQRPLDLAHAKKLAIYIVRGLGSSVKHRWDREGKHIPDVLTDFLAELGEGPYQALQPFTANIRNVKSGDLEFEDTLSGVIMHLHRLQRLYIVDGQHRLRAGELVFDWLNTILTNARYPKKGLWLPEDTQEVSPEEMEVWAAIQTEFVAHFTVDITIHVGLNADQERQLFHDLNVLGKKPSSALAIAFDAANPVTKYVNERLLQNGRVHGLLVVDQGNKKSGARLDSPAIYRDDLISTCSLLFKGAFNQSGITPPDVMHYEDYANSFWSAMSQQNAWAAPNWEKLTLLSQATMLKAMAFLVRSFHNGDEARGTPDEVELAHAKRNAIIAAIAAGRVDFGHDNALWRVYLMDQAERERLFPGIEAYITPDVVRRPYATWDTDTARLQLGTNTRDIVRYLADLVRYQLRDLGLEPRPGLVSLKRKLAEAETEKMAAA